MNLPAGFQIMTSLESAGALTTTSPGASPSQSQAGQKRPAPRGTASYARKRGNTACQVCRARKTKCDRAVPKCSFCKSTGAACIRSPADLSSFDPASLQILERIEDLSLEFRTWRTENSLVQYKLAESSASQTTSKCRISGSGLLPQSPEQVLPHDIPRTHLLRILKMNDGETPGAVSSSSPMSSFTDIEPQSANSLVDNFFKYVHVKNPILEEQPTRQLVSRLVLHGADWSAQSCLALLVCSLGALASPLGPSSHTSPGTTAYAIAHSYFLAAQKRLGSCLIDGGLVQAQCLFLAGVHLMAVFKPLEAWRMFSQALASCQSFGFLIEADSAEYGINGNSWSDSMIAEQAVYWSAWKSEQELRSDLKPPDFCSQATVEFPKFFPTPPAPAEAETEQQVRAWTFYLTEISLRRQTLLLAADISNGADRLPQFSIDHLVQMLPSRLSQINEWLGGIPDPISLKTPIAHDDICKFVLRGHVLNTFEMLHWPFLDAYISVTENREQIIDHSFGGTNISQSAQLKALAEKALSYHVERIEINKPGFYHRHHGTWFLIRTCSRSATMLLRAGIHNRTASEDGSRLFLPSGWYNSVAAVIELHRYWMAEVPDAAFRLGILESMLNDLTE